MKLVCQRLIVLIIMLTYHAMIADNRIILYLKHAPDQVLSDVEKEIKTSNLSQKIEQMEQQTPGTNSQKIMKYSLKTQLKPLLSGFAAIYGGYLDISDHDGLLSFPLRHSTPKIYIAITPKINLVNVKENTFSHREFIATADCPTSLYLFERKVDEKQNSYWDVKRQDIPADKKVNPLTIVILTTPGNLYVPEGHFFATDNAQLVLSDIYVIGRAQNEDAVLQSLDLSRFFEPITSEQKKATDNLMQKLITNI